MKILLDTNFILNCAKQKIDFVSLTNELFDEEIEWVIPLEVEKELELISKRKGEKTEDKKSAEISLEITKDFDKIVLIGDNSIENVDTGIVEYAKQNKGIVVATLDKILKEKLQKYPVKILTIRNLKSLEII